MVAEYYSFMTVTTSCPKIQCPTRTGLPPNSRVLIRISQSACRRAYYEQSLELHHDVESENSCLDGDL